MIFSNVLTLITSYLFSFRVINFVWMVVVAAYALRRWVLPGLYASIVAYKKTIAFMRSSLHSLEAHHTATVESIERQELIGNELFVKIGVWSQAVQLQREQKEQQALLYSRAFRTYKIVQKSAVDRLYLQRDILQDIHIVTLEKLENVYAHEAEQKAYTEKALANFMKSFL